MPKSYPISFIDRLRVGTDGEGVRALVFLSGCPLRCKYCINPHTWDGSREPKMLTAEEVYQYVKGSQIYILATDGGITFGGGEPLQHPQLITEVKEMSNSAMTIFVETALNVPWKNVEMTADVVDRYYIDIKTMDEDIYHQYTGAQLAPVLENLKKLLKIVDPGKIVVRIPQIPGYTDEASQKQSKEKLEELGVKRFNLFSYWIPEKKE